MSRDLLLGSTDRDWSICGAWSDAMFPKKRGFSGVVAHQEVIELSRTVGREVGETYEKIARLTAANELDPATRRGFRKVLVAWQGYSRPGRTPRPEDYVFLTNLRDKNRKYARLVETSSRSASHPARPRPPQPPHATVSPARAMIPIAVGLATSALSLAVLHRVARKDLHHELPTQR